MKIENQIQLTNLPLTLSQVGPYIPKIPIQNLDITMYNLQSNQLIILRLNPRNKEERSVSTLNTLHKLYTFDIRLWYLL